MNNSGSRNAHRLITRTLVVAIKVLAVLLLSALVLNLDLLPIRLAY